MNWSRAKSLCVLFLTLLNVFLFSCISLSKTNFELTTERKNAIQNVLSKNNIQFDTELLNIAYPPKKQLVLNKSFNYNIKPIQNFLEKNDSPKANLTVTSENVFICNNISLQTDFEKIVRIMKEPNANFICDFKIENEIVYYRQKFHGAIIYDNYFAFTLNGNRIIKIEYAYYPPGEFFGMPYEIEAPDVVLLHFIQNNLRNSPRTINDYKIIYASEKDKSNDDLITVVPYYRIVYDNLHEVMYSAYCNTNEL